MPEAPVTEAPSSEVPAANPTQALYAVLRGCDLDFFVSVPCKLLGELIETLAADDGIVYTPVTREEEGIGLAFGAHLAGRRPALVMQNSGFGNSVNAILSLLNYYEVPVVFVVSHRGSEGEPVAAQFMMGTAIFELLDAIDVRHLSIASPGELDRVAPAVAEARAAGRSLALLLPFSFWNGEG